MIVINNKYSYNGTINDMVKEYGIQQDCLCTLSIFEAPECYILETLGTLQDLTL